MTIQFLSLASLGARGDFAFLCDHGIEAEVFPPANLNPSWAYLITDEGQFYSFRRFHTLHETLDSLALALAHAQDTKARLDHLIA